uniref:Uncharacterized protein n=1 Tax=Amphilophus citrinellus TaxID=61819 RepID=A0A3Q0SWV7_AMPCI
MGRLILFFGGALPAVIPHSATDVSELREILDNQEVFAHAHTNQSLIVKLVEHQEQVADQDAAKYHFEDIASSNKALEPGAFEVTSVVALPKSELSSSECSTAWMLTGASRVAIAQEVKAVTFSTEGLWFDPWLLQSESFLWQDTESQVASLMNVR